MQLSKEATASGNIGGSGFFVFEEEKEETHSSEGAALFRPTRTYPGLAERRLIHETIRRMINTLATDLIRETEKNIQQHKVRDIAGVRAAPPLAAFSAEIYEQQRELKTFLRTHLYRHYRVMRMSAKARRIIGDLFQAFMGESRLLPPQFQQQAQTDCPRAVADYIAGMTDRYAIKEYRRLFEVGEE